MMIMMFGILSMLPTDLTNLVSCLQTILLRAMAVVMQEPIIVTVLVALLLTIVTAAIVRKIYNGARAEPVDDAIVVNRKNNNNNKTHALPYSETYLQMILRAPRALVQLATSAVTPYKPKVAAQHRRNRADGFDSSAERPENAGFYFFWIFFVSIDSLGPWAQQLIAGFLPYSVSGFYVAVLLEPYFCMAIHPVMNNKNTPRLIQGDFPKPRARSLKLPGCDLVDIRAQLKAFAISMLGQVHSQTRLLALPASQSDWIPISFPSFEMTIPTMPSIWIHRLNFGGRMPRLLSPSETSVSTYDNKENEEATVATVATTESTDSSIVPTESEMLANIANAADSGKNTDNGDESGGSNVSVTTTTTASSSRSLKRSAEEDLERPLKKAKFQQAAPSAAPAAVPPKPIKRQAGKSEEHLEDTRPLKKVRLVKEDETAISPHHGFVMWYKKEYGREPFSSLAIFNEAKVTKDEKGMEGQAMEVDPEWMDFVTWYKQMYGREPSSSLAIFLDVNAMNWKRSR